MRLFKRRRMKESTNKMSENDHKDVESFDILIQSQENNIQIYGWSLEMRSNYNGSWSTWSTYYNNKIYHSKDAVIRASMDVYNGFTNKEYRIVALYRMTDSLYRNFKIDRLLGSDTNINKYEIKAWKLKEDYDWFKGTINSNKYIHKKGAIYIQLEDGRIIRSGNYTDSVRSMTKDKLFKELIPNKLVDEIKIKDEKWLYPHLLKELKDKINNDENI